jgi:SAM-dependent methyltransferase
MIQIKKFYSELRNDLHLHGTNNGSTLNGLLKVLDHMNIKRSSNFIDIGCGLGPVPIVVSLLYKCKCYGIDYVNDYIERSRYYSDKYSSNNSLYFDTIDILKLPDDYLNSLNITHVYCLDKLFTPDAFNKLLSLCLNCESLEYIVSCHHEDYWPDTFSLIYTQKIRLISSAETKTVRIYRKQKPKTKNRNNRNKIK